MRAVERSEVPLGGSAAAGGDSARRPLGDEITKILPSLFDLVDADRQRDLVIGHADPGHEVDVDASIGQGAGCRRDGPCLVFDGDGDDRHLAEREARLVQGGSQPLLIGRHEGGTAPVTQSQAHDA